MKNIIDVMTEARMEEMSELNSYGNNDLELIERSNELFEKIREKLGDDTLWDEYCSVESELAFTDKKRFYQQGFLDGTRG